MEVFVSQVQMFPRPILARRVAVLLLLATAYLATSSAQTPSASATSSNSTGSHTITGRLLAFNDFHGALDPPTGSGGLVNGTPAGGVEYLATHLGQLRAAAEANGEQVLTLGAGDMVGRSPLLSAGFHDEPTIEALSNLGLDASAAGVFEFDHGVDELLRLQQGGCHPVDGCQDGDDFAGASFRYLAANVVDRNSRLPVLPPFEIRKFKNVKVGIVGIVPKDTPALVNPDGIEDVDFLDEVETANFYAALLRQTAGVKALVLLIHEGGFQNAPFPQDPSGCANFAGPIAGIVSQLRPEYGIVVSGRTHRFYTCALPNSSGANSIVTSAGAMGTLITSIGFTLDTRTKAFATIEAENVIVTNGVLLPDGSWERDASGNFVRDPALVDAATKAIVDEYRTAIAPIANRVVGSITADISQISNAAGESALGDVIADAQLAYTIAAGAQIALMNPGGIRASLVFSSSTGGEAPGQVTYGEVFLVQPFNLLIVTQTLTGAQLKMVLEQQFPGYMGQIVQRILQVSAGFSYSYDTTRPLGERVLNLSLNGVPIDPAASYRVTSNDFLANGGDGFTSLKSGTDRTVAPGFDIDALVAYLGSGPVSPGPMNRIVKLF
jgi:5'-nucleotidase